MAFALADIIARGGGLKHGGLVVRDGRGCILTSPQGGGKTTTVSRLPAPWIALCDDAESLWPDGRGGYVASPQPTRSALFQRSDGPSRRGPWAVGRRVDIAGAALLHKARVARATRLAPIAAAPHWYRALSEHITVVTNRGPYLPALYRLVATLARDAAAWTLEVPRNGALVEALDALATAP